MPVLTTEVSAIARRNHGVLTMEQATAAGCGAGAVRRAIERGELERLHRNVFRVAAAPRSWEQRVLAAVLAAGPGALASHRSAAALWGLDGLTRGRPEVVAPRHRRSWATHLGRCHESKDLHLANPTTRSRIPCTGVVRTLLDLGAVVPIELVQAATDDAIRRRLCSWDDLLHTMARHSRQGRRGVGPLRAILDESYGSQVPDSRFNRMVERLLVSEGLPRPSIEHEVRDTRGVLVARIDLAYTLLRIAIELDGRRYHLSSRAFESDRLRQNQLELLGWLVLRYTWRQFLASPLQIVADVRAAISARTR